MGKILLNVILLIAVVYGASCSTGTEKQINKVTFTEDSRNERIDIFIDGNLFTSFRWADSLYKPVLYPIISLSGKEVTRGYPIHPKPYERPDHPHQIGFWFTFGDVNGIDFWGNSDAIEPKDKPKYGHIKFNEVIELSPNEGKLIVKSEWKDIKDSILLLEKTAFVFGEKDGIRTIERITELTAQPRIILHEYKEGLLGLRVAREFEEPATGPLRLLDANGKLANTPILNNDGVNGVYRNAEGLIGGNVWGKQSKWVALRAVKEGEVITIVIIDHPDNINYPGWSHARGYGLFALNNLAGRDADKNTSPVEVVLNPGEKIIFKHKLVIGGDLTNDQIGELADNFN